MHISKMVLKLALMAGVGFVASTASASISPKGGSDCKNRSTYERWTASAVVKKASPAKVALGSSKPASTGKKAGKR